ncbi:MAG: transposase [Candidatus Sulfotelmatobacter sp.]|jgi:REP element-mobilizing transposase RayT
MPAGLHRSYGAHHLHFITCSCYRWLPFLGTARSRDCFLSILEQSRQRYGFVVVGYVVMPEHFHWLITEPDVGTPSTVMPVLKQRTAHALLPLASDAIVASVACFRTNRASLFGRRAFMTSTSGLPRSAGRN